MGRQRDALMPRFCCIIGLVSTLLTLATGESFATTSIFGEIRSYDGINNNMENPTWGASNQPRVRLLPREEGFYDHLDEPMDEVNSRLPSARRLMERIFSKARPHKDKTASHMLLELGHFIVQDILGSQENETEAFHVPCDGNMSDYVFCPVTGASRATMGDQTIPFHRDQYVRSARDNPRSTINGMTSFLDLSNLYGTIPHPSDDNAYWEEKYPGGKLPLTDDGLLPDRNLTGQNRKAGINTTPGAYALYVVFSRYHNLLAEEFQMEYPDAPIQDIFEASRRKTIAVYQAFVEEKYIPTLLGDGLDDYNGYDTTVDPSIDEFFAAMSFRYAHSSFGNLVRMLDKDFVPHPNDPLLLRDVFRNTVQLIKDIGGIEPFLRGLTITPAKNVDASLVEDFNVWAEASSIVDVQRGRDVGLPRYNNVRESFGLRRMQSMEELVADRYKNDNYHNDTDFILLVSALKELYHDDIDLVDAYVGALVEAPLTELDNMGPLFTMSIKDQFTRLRDGDRFWYKAIFPEEEYSNFPGLTAVIKMVCKDMDLFPDDAYLVNTGERPLDSDKVCAESSSSQLFLLHDTFSVRWHVDQDSNLPDKTIDVTLAIKEKMGGPGFLGIGWESSIMHGSKIWFCTVADTALKKLRPLPSTCAESEHGDNSQTQPFTCCLAEGSHHHRPECSKPGDDQYYPLEVVDWCLSGSESSVTVRAPVCYDDNVLASRHGHANDWESDSEGNCFNMGSSTDGGTDFIVAYSTLSNSRSHGFQRRTNAQVDLNAGVLTQSEAAIADDGLIATHGAFMLIGWMILAPFGVFVVRYMKTWKRRLVVHISVMGIVGSMMVPLLIGVEASVGATDKTAQHALIGLIIMGMFFLMAGTGRYRYLKWEGHRIGKKTDLITLAFHKYGGAAFICMAWWNCWTGLCRIGPEDSRFEIVLFSNLHLGYDINIFGEIRDYVYGPYLASVIIMFIMAEMRKRKTANASQAVIESGKSLWGDEDDSHLDTMSLETFLDVTRLGNALCIVDGRVLDISSFIDIHPGGPELLRYVRGSDITEEFCGVRDVDGVQHVHSHGAVALMKKFVKAKLVMGVAGMEPEQVSGGSRRRKSGFNSLLTRDFWGFERSRSQPFRRGKVLDVQYLSPSTSAEDQTNPVILLRLALPRGKEPHREEEVTKLPGCSFRFRGLDKRGLMFEREYNALKLGRHRESKASRDFSLASIDTEEPENRLFLNTHRSLQNLESAMLSTRSTSHKDRKSTNEKNQRDEIYDFVISLVPNGQMSDFFQTIKTGKLLLAQGPRVNPETVYQVESQRWHSVVMFAAGSGITSMLQMIDYFLEKPRGRCPRLFLIWALKSPEHNYHANLNLKGLLRRSKGCLKWVTIYSAKHPGTYEPEDVEAVEEIDNVEPRGKRRSAQATRMSQSKWNPPFEADCSTELPKSRASYLVQPSMLVSQSLGAEIRNIMWKKKRARLNVKDLISYVRDDGFVVDDVLDTFPDTSSQFDEAFWNRPHRQTSRLLDESTLKEIMASIQSYSKKQRYSRKHSGGLETDSSCDDSDEEAGESKSAEPINILSFLRNNISTEDRMIGMRLEKDCFVAKDAVDYLVSFCYASDRQHAIKLGRLLQDQNQIFSVNGPKFSDSDELFRFTLLEPDIKIGTSVSDLSTASNGDTEKSGANMDQKYLFKATLVAVSGPPMFELDMSESLLNIGLPKEQLLTFPASK